MCIRDSFFGEAEILQALEPHIGVESLKRSLESAWVRFQLWRRAEAAGVDRSALAASILELPLEELLQQSDAWYAPLMRRRRAEAWRSSGDRRDICC
eukprot:12444040-Alexandrium_andersonii.AAC.1